MLKVFLTVDVEIWPRNWDLSARAFQEGWARYIQGATSKGDYGLPFQLRVLQQHDLRAVFLVESLFAWEYGLEPLREIVGSIKQANQEVQLHLHAEWVHKSKRPILPGRGGINIKDYSEDEQGFLLGLGLRHMHESGAGDICAFRAGSYGANLATLRALSKHGIGYDTSYNLPYLDKDCAMVVDEPLVQPRLVEGVMEFPITPFEELPGRLRHMQLGSCSFSEMKHLLLQAHSNGWYSVVIVSHGHELLDASRTQPDPIVVKRFERLCRFLAENRDKFQTSGFSDLRVESVVTQKNERPLTSSPWRTALRYGEQLTMRLR